MDPLRMGLRSIESSDGRLFAAVEDANLALADPQIRHVAPGVTRLLCWSGWFGEGADPQRGIFPRDFRTWTPVGRAALHAACDAALATLTPRGVEFMLRPHARHILSDVQGCLAFLRSYPSVRLLLDPASLLTGAMLPSAEDHLRRMFENLAPHPSTAAVVLANVERLTADDSDALGPVPLHRGLIDPALLLRLWKEHCPIDLPCIVLAQEYEAQAGMLSRA